MTDNETMRILARILVADFLKQGVAEGHHHVYDYEIPGNLMPKGKQVIMTLKLVDEGHTCQGGDNEF